jgi:muconate cycloisomerase
MRINAIEPIPVALPVRREWKWRSLGGDLGRWVIVRVDTEDGLIGLGEATPLPDWGGTSTATLARPLPPSCM